jgi:hypothetical protein
VGGLLSVTMLVASLGGCRDLSRYSTDGDHYEGDVVQGAFVRAGVDENVRLCVTIDTDRLQDAPGTIRSSDGRFGVTPLRPIPQIWHDPLSTLSFGEGREKNLVYVATPEPSSGDTGGDVFVVLSLMKGGAVEVRLLRSAPTLTADTAAADSGPAPTNLFAVFTLDRKSGACSF